MSLKKLPELKLNKMKIKEQAVIKYEIGRMYFSYEGSPL
jgi:hypothetical protein